VRPAAATQNGFSAADLLFSQLTREVLSTMDDEYDQQKVAQSFQESAALAEWFYRTHVQDGLRDTGAAAKRDELLARMTLYAHLKEGKFLESRDELLAELRWLLKNERPLAPRSALDAATFGRYRSKLLQMLIQRFDQPGGLEQPESDEKGPRQARG
jgi:hypothetical protein